MKFKLKNIVAVMALVLAFTSCSNDDDKIDEITGSGSLKIEFDNVYGSADFAMNTPYTNSNGEVVKATKIKYIVSNIVLTKVDGSTYIVPKSESYFIIDESTLASTLLTIPAIPAGNYKSISYGIGVDKAQFDLGATGQGNFLTTAQTAGMMWSWSAGYKFIAFEGTFTSTGVTTETNYKLHTGQTGTDYNYATISMNFPENALVRTTITPQVHIMANLKHLLDGTNKINLSEGATIMGGSKLALATANLANMFEVHHVHND
jgi:hypothetical protein